MKRFLSAMLLLTSGCIPAETPPRAEERSYWHPEVVRERDERASLELEVERLRLERNRAQSDLARVKREAEQEKFWSDMENNRLKRMSRGY